MAMFELSGLRFQAVFRQGDGCHPRAQKSACLCGSDNTSDAASPHPRTRPFCVTFLGGRSSQENMDAMPGMDMDHCHGVMMHGRPRMDRSLRR